jgi:hypothetical protein
LEKNTEHGGDPKYLPRRYVIDENEIITEMVDGYKFEFPAGYFPFDLILITQAVSFKPTMLFSEISLDTFINK